MIKKLTLLAFLAVLGTSAFAQISYGFYAGAASPMGDLGQTKTISGADDLDNIYNWCLFDADGKYGFANLGFNIGFDMSLQSSKIKGLSYLISLDFMYNNCNSDIDTYFEKYPHGSALYYQGVTSKIPQYMNFPLLLGVKYQYDFGSAIGIFCEAALGPNFRKMTTLEQTDETYYTRYWKIGSVLVPFNKMDRVNDYDLAVTFGFKVGAGIMLWNDRISLGVDYYSLGSSKIKGKSKIKLDGKDYTTEIGGHFEGNNSISSSELVFRVGYHFQ